MRPEYMRTDNVGFQRRIPVISRLPLGLVAALPVGLTPTARARRPGSRGSSKRCYPAFVANEHCLARRSLLVPSNGFGTLDSLLMGLNILSRQRFSHPWQTCHHEIVSSK